MLHSTNVKASLLRCNSYNGTKEPEVYFTAEYCNTRFSPIILVFIHFIRTTHTRIKVGLILYLVSFQSGVGPVPWVYNPEVDQKYYWYQLFKILLRSILSGSEALVWASPLGSTGHWTLLSLSLSPISSKWADRNIILYKLNFPPQGLGFGAYYLFAGMAVIASVWFALVMPESKVKSCLQAQRRKMH